MKTGKKNYYNFSFLQFLARHVPYMVSHKEINTRYIHESEKKYKRSEIFFYKRISYELCLLIIYFKFCKLQKKGN